MPDDAVRWLRAAEGQNTDNLVVDSCASSCSDHTDPVSLRSMYRLKSANNVYALLTQTERRNNQPPDIYHTMIVSE